VFISRATAEKLPVSTVRTKLFMHSIRSISRLCLPLIYSKLE
jgi:hypothetical protein